MHEEMPLYKSGSITVSPFHKCHIAMSAFSRCIVHICISACNENSTMQKPVIIDPLSYFASLSRYGVTTRYRRVRRPCLLVSLLSIWKILKDIAGSTGSRGQGENKVMCYLERTCLSNIHFDIERVSSFFNFVHSF